MSRRLRVPVTVDRSGWLRCGVELRFRRGVDGTIHPEGIRVGAEALVDDVLALGDVFERSTRYNELLGSLRRMRDRLEALARDSALGLELGQRRALLELDDLVGRRQATYMGHGTVRVDTLDLEIEFLRQHHAHLANAVARARAARTGSGTGHRAFVVEGGSVDLDE